MSSTTAVSDTKSASPTKTDAAGTKSTLTPKEEELFKVAMLFCLKSGAPEIDIDKFITHGEFKTKKTAQNTWARIKSKMFPKKETAEGEGEDGAATPKTTKTPQTPKTPSTPKTTKTSKALTTPNAPNGGPSTPLKRTSSDDLVDDEEEVYEEGSDAGSPKKKPRTMTMKQRAAARAFAIVAAEIAEAVKGDGIKREEADEE
ncbi:uncharacterized protein LTR77_007251 [Saxophila tyrrhenica]|uniref:Uncharacterized protein n=1 Tax=Saxophila tyrrhenica TaxID=1690608 RepID=A0AAV9P7Z9_9PEZI|nr:hypothetical protein LTR77_007251 [Saxophila tyrrhenica]